MKAFNIMAAIIASLVLAAHAQSSETVTDEPGNEAYNFVSHYRVAIDAPVEVVWKHLVDLNSWMYQFAMERVSGMPGEKGAVFRLYSGEDFLAQITAVVRNELLVIVNLPSTFQDEYSTGVGVTTLNRARGKTIVDLTMSRRYTWHGSGVDQTKQTRESREFQQGTRTTWNDFLARLRSLAEAEYHHEQEHATTSGGL